MITSDDVFDRLAAANPQPDISDLVPTPSQFAEFLRDLEEAPVHTITKPPEPDKRTRRGGLLVAAAAFAVVIVIGGVWLLAAREPAEPPTNVEPTTTALPSTTATTTPPEDEPRLSDAAKEVVDLFAETYNAGDIVSHMLLMQPGLTIVAGDRGGRPSPNGTGMGITFPRDLASYEDRLKWERALGTTVEMHECEGDTRVTCTATYHDFLSDAILGGDTVRIEFGIRDGLIIDYTETAINGAVFDSFLNGIRAWVDREYGIDLDHNDVVTEDPLDWSVYGRMYLDSINMPVPEMAFAPGVDPRDVRLMLETLRWIEDGAAYDIESVWPDVGVTYSPVRSLNSDQTAAWAAWLKAVDADISLAGCESASDGYVTCAVRIDEDLRRAIGGPNRDWLAFWTFNPSDNVVMELTVDDARIDEYLAGVAAFAEWASLREEPVAIEIDPTTGDFVPTESNIAAYRALIGEYLETLGG